MKSTMSNLIQNLSRFICRFNLLQPKWRQDKEFQKDHIAFIHFLFKFFIFLFHQRYYESRKGMFCLTSLNMFFSSLAYIYLKTLLFLKLLEIDICILKLFALQSASKTTEGMELSLFIERKFIAFKFLYYSFNDRIIKIWAIKNRVNINK